MSEGTAPRTHVRTPETDEVLRRIGRNVVIFQQVEFLLKYLNTHSAYGGPASELAARFEKHAAKVQKKMMGELAGSLVDDILRPVVDEEAPDEISEPWLSFRFSLNADAEFIDRHDREMRDLVESRNDLIHHFLPRWLSAVAGDAESALAYLDARQDETTRMMERLKGWAVALDSGRKEHLAYLESPEAKREEELVWLRSSRLVAMLGEIAMHTPREDGWTLLSIAGQIIKRDAPSELQDLTGRFGYSSLKRVLLATELFDIAEEPTSGGGTKTIYRINERYELHIDREPPGA